MLMSFDVQIAEAVNSMKDLMDFCRDHKVGPFGNFPFFHYRTVMIYMIDL